MPDLIPAGKTSLVRKGTVALQVQTEYASRPYPRITTTILNQGQVLHKVEQKLEHAIENMEERSRMEQVIKQQHGEIEKLIKSCSSFSQPQPQPQMQQQVEKTEEKKDGVAGASPTPSKPTPHPVPPRRMSLLERFADIPGFEYVYQLDNDGNFKTEAAKKQFKKMFKKVFCSLEELLLVFPKYPNSANRREQGVYEVISERLYLISTGQECFLISVIPLARWVDYEKEIREIVFSHES